ncbi:MAG: hypothetical protein KJ623_01400 [Nanoarchaeota archaeon]|nr:hypothetical protein [Nanoarchaeota archaeon]MBU0963146.1 hypothetical protein [Nanoarchaeota archaeon]
METISFNGLEKKTNPLYIPSCKGGGKNLNEYKLGHYTECYECDKQKKCRDIALIIGESAEL